MCAVNHDAVFGRLFFHEHEMIARSEERFAWNAAYVEAGAAQVFVFLNERGFQPELSGTDGSNVSSRAGADDNNIKFFHGCVLSF